MAHVSSYFPQKGLFEWENWAFCNVMLFVTYEFSNISSDWEYNPSPLSAPKHMVDWKPHFYWYKWICNNVNDNAANSFARFVKCSTVSRLKSNTTVPPTVVIFIEIALCSNVTAVPPLPTFRNATKLVMTKNQHPRRYLLSFSIATLYIYIYIYIYMQEILLFNKVEN